MKIEQLIELLRTDERFDIIECPNCHKSGFAFCQNRAEYANEGPGKPRIPGTSPKAKRLRLFFSCLYCKFACSDEEDLKKLGIDPEVEK